MVLQHISLLPPWSGLFLSIVFYLFHAILKGLLVHFWYFIVSVKWRNQFLYVNIQFYLFISKFLAVWAFIGAGFCLAAVSWGCCLVWYVSSLQWLPSCGAQALGSLGFRS